MSRELSELTEMAVAVSNNVEEAFGGLSEEQLNWKPDVESWSVAQCLEHLIITNELEFPAIHDAFRSDRRNPLWSRIPLLPWIFGRLMIWLFATESTRRVKAPKMFQPSASALPRSIVETFIGHQREIVKLLEKSRALDLDRTKIVSPVSNFVTYSLRDAFTVLVGHERRHLRQALRVVQSEEFPR